MFNRWLGIVTLALMLSANAALFLRDVVPEWLAGEPPASRSLGLKPNQEVDLQLGLFDQEGRRIGYAWTRSGRSGELITVRHNTVLEPLGLAGGMSLPLLRIDTTLHYMDSSYLDQLKVNVYGLGFPIRIHGEYVPPDKFPCEWQFDMQRGTFLVPASATHAIGDVIRPFESFSNLTVGQSWRVKLVNPLAQLVPEWGKRALLPDSILVRVTRTEQIEHHNQTVEAFVVEAERVRAWVSPQGRVLRQEVELPLFGRLTLVDEPYDNVLREEKLSSALQDE